MLDMTQLGQQIMGLGSDPAVTQALLRAGTPSPTPPGGGMGGMGDVLQLLSQIKQPGATAPSAPNPLAQITQQLLQAGTPQPMPGMGMPRPPMPGGGGGMRPPMQQPPMGPPSMQGPQTAGPSMGAPGGVNQQALMQMLARLGGTQGPVGAAMMPQGQRPPFGGLLS